MATDKTVAVNYYFKFFQTNRTFIGFTRADALRLEEIDTSNILLVLVSMPQYIIEDLVYEGICADFREDDPDYLYLGYTKQSTESNRHYTFIPELKYNVKDGTIIFIDEADRVTTTQVIGG